MTEFIPVDGKDFDRPIRAEVTIERYRNVVGEIVFGEVKLLDVLVLEDVVEDGGGTPVSQEVAGKIQTLETT